MWSSMVHVAGRARGITRAPAIGEEEHKVAGRRRVQQNLWRAAHAPQVPQQSGL